MDFVVCRPMTRKLHDFIGLIVDRMTKSSHIIPVKSTNRAEHDAKLYIYDIVR